jgi:hypothetical protein
LPEFSSGWPKYQVMKQSVKLYSASDWSLKTGVVLLKNFLRIGSLYLASNKIFKEVKTIFGSFN